MYRSSVRVPEAVADVGSLWLPVALSNVESDMSGIVLIFSVRGTVSLFMKYSPPDFDCQFKAILTRNSSFLGNSAADETICHNSSGPSAFGTHTHNLRWKFQTDGTLCYKNSFFFHRGWRTLTHKNIRKDCFACSNTSRTSGIIFPFLLRNENQKMSLEEDIQSGMLFTFHSVGHFQLWFSPQDYHHFHPERPIKRKCSPFTDSSRSCWKKRGMMRSDKSICSVSGAKLIRFESDHAP